MSTHEQAGDERNDVDRDDLEPVDRESRGGVDGVDRDELEGTYTEVDGEGPVERTVHGQYTETDGVGPETETKGSYTDTDETAEVSAEEEQGDYTERDR